MSTKCEICKSEIEDQEVTICFCNQCYYEVFEEDLLNEEFDPMWDIGD